MKATSHFPYKPLLFLIASIAFIALAFVFNKKLVEFQSLGLAGIFLINLLGSATIFLPAPSIVSIFAGGLVYPPILVAFASSLGSALGEMVGFVLGHSSKHVFSLHKKSIWSEVLERKFKQYGGYLIFLFAIIPNPFFDAVGIIAGVFVYSPVKFFLWVFIARLIRDTGLAYIGSAFIK